MQHTSTCRHQPSSASDTEIAKGSPCPPKEADPCGCAGDARLCEAILCFLCAQLGALGCGCLEWVSGSVQWFATSGQILLGECDCECGASGGAEILVRIGCSGKPTILRVRCPMKGGKVDPEGRWTYRLDGADGWSAFCPGGGAPPQPVG